MSALEKTIDLVPNDNEPSTKRLTVSRCNAVKWIEEPIARDNHADNVLDFT